jgi:hypothetical protein
VFGERQKLRGREARPQRASDAGCELALGSPERGGDRDRREFALLAAQLRARPSGPPNIPSTGVE